MARPKVLSGGVPLEPTNHQAVECRSLVVRYGELTAVDELSFDAAFGEVLAVLGPNGAGKTSTIETLEGYRRPDGGTVRVAGLDPRTEHAALVPQIGVMLQKGGVYPTMASGRALELFSHYYRDPEDPRELLERVGLDHASRTPWRHLSGGEQQRLSLALALVGQPRVLFLDEPTAGVDPEGRLAVRRVVRELRDGGACIVLTTHELAEAERIADRVLVIDHGRKVIEGAVHELSAGAGDHVAFTAEPGLDTHALTAALRLRGGAVTETSPGCYRVQAEPGPALIASLTAWLAERDITLSGLDTGRASLEDVYLALVANTQGSAGSPQQDEKDG